jgi:hypothetical protein
MKALKWLPTLLAAGGLVWCFVVGWRIWVTPVRYLQYSSAEPAERFVDRHFSEVSGLGIVPLVVPTVLAGLATWAAWRRRLLGLFVVTLVFFGFCFITGFSIGAAYVPIAPALLVATLISAAGRAVARMRKGAV